MMEAQVHRVLVALAREQYTSAWPHHLTLARLVARGFRLGRSALIQTRTGAEDYALSYLTPALMESQPVAIVAPPLLLDWLQWTEIPRLQDLLGTSRLVLRGSQTLFETRSDLIALISPHQWLTIMTGDRLPPAITTILNPVDELWQWSQDFFSCELTLTDWEALAARNPGQRVQIQADYDQLKGQLLRRSPNPYRCYPLKPEDQQYLVHCLALPKLPPSWQRFVQRWQQSAIRSFFWANLDHRTGQFSLQVSPQNLSPLLNHIWQYQPTLFIGNFLTPERQAPNFAISLGINPESLTYVDFTPPRQQQQIQVYLPERRLPLPNTPEFQAALLGQLRELIHSQPQYHRPIVLLINDVPLQAQMAARLAAEWGSRVRLEPSLIAPDTVLICGWDYWRRQTTLPLYGQSLDFPLPQLMAIATLPFPSLENPLVAARVAQYKQQRQDWFRLYLLPRALSELQRAIYPLRRGKSFIGILDNRINHRAYGQLILDALQPYYLSNYIESD